MTSLNPSDTKEARAFKKAVLEFAREAPQLYLPGISVDTVIFGYHHGKLKILLQQLAYTSAWSLPAGYIGKNQHIDDAAVHTLKERTGLTDVPLEQFYTSGAANRATPNVLNEFFNDMFKELPADHWFRQRFITICYYALVDFTKVELGSDLIFTELKWHDIKKIPRLIFDHNVIISKALQRLQNDLDDKIATIGILGESFTMADLQQLYESVHQKKFVRTNFQRKMLAMQFLERLEKKYSGKAHKAPYLYRFI